MDRPSATDFLAFKWLMFSCKTLDVGEVYLKTHRKVRRAIEKTIGQPLRIRSEEEILNQLMEMGEDCDFNDVERVLNGVPKARWRKFVAKWITRRPKPGREGIYQCAPSNSPHEVVRQKNHFEYLPLGRWFSGKRYGVSVDEEVAKALSEAEVDVSVFDIFLPWEPILVKLGDEEFFMYHDKGKAVFLEFSFDKNGDVTHSGAPAQISSSKKAVAAWIACVSKGESTGDCFELKVGNRLVALLPKINAKTIVLKHKISAEAEVDKGAWIRKGYFRSTKDGVAWVDGTLCRKELPFVHKVHEIHKKGQPQESLEGS